MSHHYKYVHQHQACTLYDSCRSKSPVYHDKSGNTGQSQVRTHQHLKNNYASAQ